MTMNLTLYGRIPSKKNWTFTIWKNWKQIKLPSKKYQDWEKEQIKEVKWISLDNQENLCITCDFYLPDNRKTDLSNKFESIADMLVKAKVLEDDNAKILSEVHLVYRWVDKENPRVIISIV